MFARWDRVVATGLLAVLCSCSETPTDRGVNDQAAAPIGEDGTAYTNGMATVATDTDTAGSAVPGNAAAAPASPPAAASTTPAQADVVLAVEGEGLRLFDRQTSAASPIAFGRPAAEVLAALERLRGAAGKGTNQDCGAGPVQYANWADGLSLVFQRDRFVGWGLDGRAAGAISTASGIGPGSTRAQLDDAYGDVRFTRSSIGQEFAVGGFYGVLDGTTAGSKITDMWAGVSCVAR